VAWLPELTKDGRTRTLPSKETAMAKLALVYGLRLFPAEELEEVKAAAVALKGGRAGHVTMHLLEGSKEEIEKQFHMSVEAFFEMYPEIS
jgi:hypothetical protein